MKNIKFFLICDRFYELLKAFDGEGLFDKFIRRADATIMNV